MNYDDWKLQTPPENTSYQEDHEKGQADCLVEEANYRLTKLIESKPKQSEIDFREAVVQRCEAIRDKIYEYWDKLN